MLDRDSRKAARRAYKQARRDARYQYRLTRHMYRQNWRRYSNRRSIVPFIVLIIFFGFLFRSHFFYMNPFSHIFLPFSLPVVLIAIGVIAFFVLRSFSFRGSKSQNPYHQPYDPSAQRPPQNSEHTYYPAPPSPTRVEQPLESYGEYNQGYQSGGNAATANLPLYHPKEGYSPEERPQASYPQQIPPMEQM